MDDLTEKKVFFVIGEESGDALGSDLLEALELKAAGLGIKINAVGLAGERMSAHGMESLFDISEIAVMGISAVIVRLPKIIARINNTVTAVEKELPDIIVLIDSPDFTHSVAKRVRKNHPNIPIVNYVCPSVWAWRQGRARKMAVYVDHVLTLLPFEPLALEKLDGPPATYVGHRLVEEMRDFAAHEANAEQGISESSTPVLLVLPGSRRGELKSLLGTFGDTVDFLHQRGLKFRCIVPAVPHLADEIRTGTADWTVNPEIVVGEENKLEVFRQATAALAVSGTISLELALAGVPMVLAFKLDAVARPFGFLIKTWSAALPNLIADYVVVPEEVNETASKGRLGRLVERLLKDTPERRAQLAGLELVAARMQVDQPPGEKAADIILQYIGGSEIQ